MGCINQKSQTRQSQPHKIQYHIQPKIIHLPQSKPPQMIPIEDKSIELNMIKSDSHISQLNNSQRPHWVYTPPIKQEDIVVRDPIPNQSNINIIYSSDPKESFSKPQPKQIKPIAIIVEEIECESAIQPQHSVKRKLYQNDIDSRIIKFDSTIPVGTIDNNESMVIKRAESVLEKAFNDERVMDIIGFDLRMLKVEINPYFAQNHNK